jgi:hypothetical protein
VKCDKYLRFKQRAFTSEVIKDGIPPQFPFLQFTTAENLPLERDLQLQWKPLGSDEEFSVKCAEKSLKAPETPCLTPSSHRQTDR